MDPILQRISQKFKLHESQAAIDASRLKDINPDIILFRATYVTANVPNKNDDLFLLDEIISTIESLPYKPIDLEHKHGEGVPDGQIVGVTLDFGFMDKEGNEVATSDNYTQLTSEQWPPVVDVWVAGLIWAWMYPSVADMLTGTEAAIASRVGVSLHCWFPSFDYGLIRDTKIKIIKRDECTAFLDRHLKVYGGSGWYEGYRIVRVPRRPLWGSCALVKRGANPRSTIHQVISSDQTYVGKEDNLGQQVANTPVDVTSIVKTLVFN